MKRVNKFIPLKSLWLLLPIMILASCGSKTSTEMSSSSPDGKVTIFVNGTKPSFGDPWQAKIKIKTSTDEKEVITEIFAGELNNENVKFSWETNDRCRIVFSQQDDTERKMVIQADSTQINLHEE
jgi:ABC-type oligopeptide transport system substrate-binding subunit